MHNVNDNINYVNRAKSAVKLYNSRLETFDVLVYVACAHRCSINRVYLRESNQYNCKRGWVECIVEVFHWLVVVHYDSAELAHHDHAPEEAHNYGHEIE